MQPELAACPLVIVHAIPAGDDWMVPDPSPSPLTAKFETDPVNVAVMVIGPVTVAPQPDVVVHGGTGNPPN